MNALPLMLVIASAASHTLWNILAKDSEDKESYMLLMTVSSLFTLLPIFVFILPNSLSPGRAVPFLIISGLAETIYFVSLGKAYMLGDLSIVYPLARSSPLFLSVLSVLLLNEKISGWGAVGIILILFGVYTVHLKSFSTKDLLMPLRSLRAKASQFAVLTALATTAYSMADKIGVTLINPILYAFWLEFFTSPFLAAAVLKMRGWRRIAVEWKNSKKKVMIGGFLMRFGYILVLYAMSLIQVSYVLALRQISVVLGAVAGVLILRESYGKIRIVGSIIMFAGVYILTVLA